MRISVGLGTEKDVLQAVRSAAASAQKNLASAKAELALVFCSAEFCRPMVFKVLRELLGPVELIGASTFAPICGQKAYTHGILVALLAPSKDTFLNAARVEDITAKGARRAGDELGNSLLYGFKNIRRDLGLLFSDGLLNNGSGFLSGLEERLGRIFPLAGAGASDNLAFKKTFTFFNEELSGDSACGLLLGGKINFGLGTRHGWKPLGKMRRASLSYGNILREIDGQPANRLYEDYFSRDAAGLKKELRRISIFYPLGIHIPGQKEYLLRNLSQVREDGSLVFQGDIPQDSDIRLMIGTKDSCLAASRLAAEEAKRALMGRPAGFALVFNAVSRYMLLGRDAPRELEAIREVLGASTQILGMHTYGEQAPLSSLSYLGKSYFHNQTMTIVAIEG
jgi:hypothetical protein